MFRITRVRFQPSTHHLIANRIISIAQFTMKYLNVKISINGMSNGANVDYGSRILEVELPADFDEQKLFSECARAVYVAENK